LLQYDTHKPFLLNCSGAPKQALQDLDAHGTFGGLVELVQVIIELSDAQSAAFTTSMAQRQVDSIAKVARFLTEAQCQQ
jgi:hypothetical protein